MANDITGSCDIGDSVELVPDDVDDIVPPGYLDEGSLDLSTGDTDIGVDPDNGMAVTGDCASTDCPPGYTWGCCLDDTVEYPPGEPAFQACEIKTYATSQFAYAHTFLTEIGDYLWTPAYSSWNNFNLFDKQGNKIKTVSFPDLPNDDGRPFVRPSGNPRGWFPVESGGLVWSLTNTWFGDYPNKQFIIYRFDLEGNFVDYILTPIEYQLDIIDGTQQIVPYNNGIIMTCPNGYLNQALGSSRLMWYDFYGTIYNIVDITSQTPSRSIHVGSSCTMISDNYLYLGYEYELTNRAGRVHMFTADTGEYIRTLDKDLVSEGEDVFGQRIRCLSSNGKEDIIAVGLATGGGGYHPTDSTNNGNVWFYKPNGDFIKKIHIPDDQPYGVETEQYNLPSADSLSRFGDYILLTYENSDATSNTGNANARGTTYVLDENLDIVTTVSKDYPIQARGDKLGDLTWFNKDTLIMHSGNGSSGAKYMKVCKVNWN